MKLSFSAYGERRDVDWDGSISSTHLATAANTTRHGYTDHEHLGSVKLIHLGGRVYDPLIGRFLSRDPYIDGVGSSQGANGYGYVRNNPLTRWDPTGYGKAESLDVRNWCEKDLCDPPVVVTGSRLCSQLGCTYTSSFEGLSEQSQNMPGHAGPTSLPGTTAIGPIPSDAAPKEPLSDTLDAMTAVATAVGGSAEELAKIAGDDLLKGAASRLNIGASVAELIQSTSKGDYKAALVSAGFLGAQFIVRASPFGLTAVTVANVAFTVGRVAGGE